MRGTQIHVVGEKLQFLTEEPIMFGKETKPLRRRSEPSTTHESLEEKSDFVLKHSMSYKKNFCLEGNPSADKNQSLDRKSIF